MSKRIALAVGVALLAACAQDTPTGPGSSAAPASRPEASQAAGADRVVVLNQNVYPGANVDAVITALANNDPSDDLPALFAAIEELRVNDAQARAAGIVDQIARYRPDVVGLNEITEIDVDLHPIGVDVEVHQRFLDLIQAEAAQANFLRRALMDADQLRAGMVIWYLARDPSVDLGANFQPLSTVGLFAADGRSRPGLQLWRLLVDRPPPR